MALSLEKYLEDAATKSSEEFPSQHVNYWKRYDSLLQSLKTHVYPQINAGLACISKSPGLYTDHGPHHFDEVVKYAGLLLGETLNQSNPALNPYEVYLLLCAIRLHDAGNIDGREDHQNRVSALLVEYGGDIRRDGAEVELISAIAQAHGGRTIDNSKDTIGILQEETCINATRIKPRLIAALVRFADEICEHSSRASTHHISAGTLPEQNKLFHYYAKSVVGALPDRGNKSFRLRLSIDIAWLTDQYPTPPDENGNVQEKYLFDDALDRICKLNHERVYCNRFLLPQMQTDLINVEINFTKATRITGSTLDVQQTFDALSFSIQDKGYPSVPDNWRTDNSSLTGLHFANLSKNGWQQ